VLEVWSHSDRCEACLCVVAQGQLTTPQLHFIVHHINNSSLVAADDTHTVTHCYYSKLTSAFTRLFTPLAVRTVPVSVCDCILLGD